MWNRFWTLLLVIIAAPVSAHGTAGNHLQLMVIGNRIKMNIVVDMRVLKMADTDHDGYASLDELAAGSNDITDWVREAFDVTDSRGNSGDVVFADITSDLNIAHANGDRIDHARILRTVAFPDMLTTLQIDVFELARVIPELRVTIVDSASGMRYTLSDPRDAHIVPLPDRL